MIISSTKKKSTTRDPRSSQSHHEHSETLTQQQKNINVSQDSRDIGRPSKELQIVKSTVDEAKSNREANELKVDDKKKLEVEK